MEFSVKSLFKTYSVAIETGSVVDSKGGLLSGINPDDFMLIIDENVYNLYGGLSIISSCGGNILRIHATESEKSINGVIKIYSRFLSGKITRRHTVIAIGGGIVQDLTGFACHTYMRGLRWWFIPTTLLAQADSCIGSKTSINFESSKNILGSFYPPDRIVIDPLFLNTLKREEVISGIGEIVKVHCMDSEKTLLELGADLAELKGLNPEYLNKYIRRSLDIKRRFIEKDEFDTGHRLLLNYGHCFGHALEAASNFAVPHGIGVIFGIAYANILSLNRGILSEAHYGLMQDIASGALEGFSTRWVDPSGILHFLKQDKKRTGSSLAMIVCEGIGRQKKVSDVSEEEFYENCAAFRRAMAPFFTD